MTAWLACIGCPSTTEPTDVETVAAVPPSIAVRDGRSDLVFTFQDAKTGSFSTATDRNEVPKAARKAVVVTDLSLSPAQRQAGRYVYVTDLTKARADGSYPVAVASRYGFEAGLTGTSSAGLGLNRKGVVIYSASWCGVCKTTKRLLKQWGVPFVDKDIEASRSAQIELANKAAAANVRPGGVPVIDVAGILLQGLDEQQLKDALTARGFL